MDMPSCPPTPHLHPAHAHHPVFLHRRRRPSSPVSFISHLNASAASPHANNTHAILFAVLVLGQAQLWAFLIQTQSPSAMGSGWVMLVNSPPPGRPSTFLRHLHGHDGRWIPTHVASAPHQRAPVHTPSNSCPRLSTYTYSDMSRTLSASRHPTCQVWPLAARWRCRSWAPRTMLARRTRRTHHRHLSTSPLIMSC